MRSTYFRQTLNETTIEVDADYLDTIQRLIAQEGICRNTDTAGNCLEMYCSCDGKLTVNESRRRRRSSSLSRSTYVAGEVVEESGKTKPPIWTL